MIEIKEVLRLWLAGHALREVTRLAGLDRQAVRRYVQAAQAAGITRESGDGQLSEEVLGGGGGRGPPGPVPRHRRVLGSHRRAA